MSNSVHDNKRAKLAAASGSNGSIDTMERDYYSTRSGLGANASKFSVTDHKIAFYLTKGITPGSLTDMEVAYFRLCGAVGTVYSSIHTDFWANRSFV